MRKVDCIYVPVLRPDQVDEDDGDGDKRVVHVNEKRQSQAVVVPTRSEMSSSTPPITAESKIELLESRVRALERMMSHMVPRYNDQYAPYACITV